jgi:predicted acetyltransferase
LPRVGGALSAHCQQYQSTPRRCQPGGGGAPSWEGRGGHCYDMRMDLVHPAEEHLTSYMDALDRGWSADTHRPDARLDEMMRITADPVGFLTDQIDPEGRAAPITLPDGSVVPRLPSYRLWMWDGAFCGSISFRWQPGTTALPPHCLGHIGYSVVPWKRGRGYATQARDPYITAVTCSNASRSQRRMAAGRAFVSGLRCGQPREAEAWRALSASDAPRSPARRTGRDFHESGRVVA